MTTHQAALESKREKLKERIAEETARPRPDEQLLAGLKKQKLKLKEELASL